MWGTSLVEFPVQYMIPPSILTHIYKIYKNGFVHIAVTNQLPPKFAKLCCCKHVKSHGCSCGQQARQPGSVNPTCGCQIIIKGHQTCAETDRNIPRPNKGILKLLFNQHLWHFWWMFHGLTVSSDPAHLVFGSFACYSLPQSAGLSADGSPHDAHMSIWSSEWERMPAQRPRWRSGVVIAACHTTQSESRRRAAVESPLCVSVTAVIGVAARWGARQPEKARGSCQKRQNAGRFLHAGADGVRAGLAGRRSQWVGGSVERSELWLERCWVRIQTPLCGPGLDNKSTFG